MKPEPHKPKEVHHHPHKPKASTEPKREPGDIDIPDEQQVQKSLEAIYLDQKTGKAPDLAKLDHKKRHGFLRFLGAFTAFLVILAGIAWLGIKYLAPYQSLEIEEGLAVSIEGPHEIALGKEESFTIEYKNQDVAPIQDLDMRVNWPAEFVVTSINPPPTDTKLNRWNVDLLPVGSKGLITVKGVFVGELGAVSHLQVTGSYVRNGLNDSKQILETQDLLYRSTLVKGELHLPEKIIAGDPVTIEYLARQQGNQPLRDVWLRLMMPDGFDVEASSTAKLQAKQEGQTLYVPMGSLSESTTGTVRLQGAFPTTIFGDLSFEGALGRFGVDDQFLPMHLTKTTVPVLAGDFTVRLVANGADASSTIPFGTPVHVSLGYQNTSPEAIKDASIQLQFESFIDGKSSTGTSLLNWSALEDSNHGATTTKSRIQTIAFDKRHIAEFENLPSQSQGLIEVSLPTLAAPSGTKSAVIIVKAQANAPTVGGTKVNRVIKLKPIQLTYRTDATVAAEARYFTEEGAPVGSGPLPPIAGQVTTYRLEWRLDKTFHDLKNVSVSATLPRVANWGGKAASDAGTIIYNTSTRSIVWTMNAVPADVNELMAHFNVEVTPESVDIERFAAVLNATTIQFMDGQTGDIMNLQLSPLNTDLQNDEGAKGKGVVRKDLDQKR